MDEVFGSYNKYHEKLLEQTYYKLHEKIRFHIVVYTKGMTYYKSAWLFILQEMKYKPKNAN